MLNEKRMNAVLQKLDATQMLVTDSNAIFYLTGKWIFPGERFLGLLIRQNAEPLLYVNELFRFEEELGIKKIYIKDTDNIASLLAQNLNHHEILGVDKTLEARFLLPMLKMGVAEDYIGRCALRKLGSNQRRHQAARRPAIGPSPGCGPCGPVLDPIQRGRRWRNTTIYS